MVAKYIEKNKHEEMRRNKLYEYYIAKHAIEKRILADSAKPNNRIVNPFARYITDTMTGFFIGEPITYKSNNEELIAALAQILNYNDEASENSELAKDASICGEAYELLYIDEDGATRFKRIKPIKAIPIYDDTVEEELLYFIRYYENEDIMNGNITTYVEVYSRADYKLYKMDISALTLIDEKAHAFGAVPIVVYKNNEENLGDFEPVLSLIDAYDTLSSDTVNDVQAFVDAYLVLTGMLGTEAEDIAAMRENRVILLDSDSKAEWLVKNGDGTTNMETIKERITQDIHKFSFCPAMTDENFAGNASGVAMKYKLMGLENATAKKESSFKKGIQRRLELICNILYLMGTSYDYREVEVVFTRNIPSNLAETADTINKIGNLLSEETRISILPLDINYTEEKERKEREAEAGYDNYYELLGQENNAEQGQGN